MLGGELDPFGEALLACHASMYRYARALCHDPANAEELVQEAYRRALASRNRPMSLTLESVRPWLFTILRNHWLNEIRRRQHDAVQAVEGRADLVCEDTPENIVARRFLQSEVREALDTLPVPHREVLILREMEGLSYAEIAALLGCPLGTVMSRLARARAALRNILAKIAPASRGVTQR